MAFCPSYTAFIIEVIMNKVKPLYGQNSMSVAVRYYSSFFFFAGNTSYGHVHFEQMFLTIWEKRLLLVKQHSESIAQNYVCFMSYIYFGIPRGIY